MRIAFALTAGVLICFGIVLMSPRVQVTLRMQANAKVDELAQSAALGNKRAFYELVKFAGNENGGNAIAALTRISSRLPKSTVETDILPVIGRALASPNDALRRQAASAADDLSKDYICQIVPHLQSMALKDSAQGNLAVQCIARCGRDAIPALVAIAEKRGLEPLRGGGADLFAARVVAVEAIVELGESDAKTAGALEGLIDDSNPYVQVWAAIGLMDSPHAQKAEGVLKTLINSEDPEVAAYTKETLRLRKSLSTEIQELVR